LEQFANYGIDADTHAAIVERFAQWAADIDLCQRGGEQWLR
jgi:hypothetical protein